MKKFSATFGVLLVSLPIFCAYAQQGHKIRSFEILGERKEYYFDDDAAGGLPANFESDCTGNGKPARWVVKKIEKAPSADNIVAQVGMDSRKHRFPLLILNGLSYKDAMAFVRFRPVDGKADQAGGLTFRYRDNNNYYVFTANAMENSVSLYRVVNGNITELARKNTKVTPKEWHIIKVIYTGNRIRCFFNDTKVIDVSDETFREGSVGLWTKSDSYTFFDDLVIQEIT